MRESVRLCAAMAILLSTAGAWSSENAGRITVIEGSVSVLRTGADAWRKARPGMPLRPGDQIHAAKESFVEIRYAGGAIVRLDEHTKIEIEAIDKNGSRTKHALGGVWVNMRKLVGSQRQFELSSPTAIASIRGTRFQMTTAKDSSTDVAVFAGAVAVGPHKNKKNTAARARPEAGAPVEVPGPGEVPGPYEVTLAQWKTIVAGQRIRVRGDGAYARESFDPRQEAKRSSFVAKNRAMDAALERRE